jgi:hypothetical protein
MRRADTVVSDSCIDDLRAQNSTYLNVSPALDSDSIYEYYAGRVVIPPSSR